MTKFIFHLGLHKTGTSALQASLCALRDALIANGCLFPRTGIDIPHMPAKLDAHRGHGRLMDAIRRGATPGRRFIFDCLRREIEQSGAGTVILSSEKFGAPQFETLLPRLKSEIAGENPCEAVIYLRRQDRWLDSFYREALCWPESEETGDVEAFFEARAEDWFDFARRLAAWEEIFGADALKVRFYDDLAAQDGDIVGDFLSLAGIEMPTRPAARLNPSLPRHLTGFMREANRARLEAPAKARLSRELVAKAEPDPPGSSLVTGALYDRIAARFAGGNAEIAARFGAVEQSGFLFTKAAPETREVRQSIDAPLAAALIAGLGASRTRASARPASNGNSFGIVTTLKQSRAQTEDYVSYHLNLGAQHMVLFFDDPADPLASVYEHHDSVTVLRCDDAHWNRRLGRPPERMYEKQKTNYAEGYGLLTEKGLDWVISLDCDELLHADRPIGEILAAAEPAIEGVTLPPFEAVLHPGMPPGVFRSRYFKSLEHTEPFSAEELAQVYGRDIAALTRRGFFGHVQGKQFVRSGLALADFGVHSPATARGRVRARTASEMRVLHFDCLSVERWREKWHRRIFGSTRAVDITPMRKRQEEHLKRALSSNEEGALGELARQWFWFDMAEINDLALSGLVRRFDLDARLFTRSGARPSGMRA